MSSYNRNPTGKNQHKKDERQEQIYKAALVIYHSEKITDNKKIVERMLLEYGIKTSASTVKRRRKEYGLMGGAATEKTLTESQIEQYVLNVMDEDTAKCWGLRTVWHKVASEKGIILTRDTVWRVMQTHDADSFSAREPTAKKIFRVQKYPLGIHERWSGDGHDKLYKIGFPIWMMVDDATSKVLKAWVVPSNRMGDIIAYLFLCLAEEYGGVPLQTTTDCGCETTLLYGIVNAIRDMFHPGLSEAQIQAHNYLRSVHNIAMERTWLRLRLDFGDTAVLNFNQGVADLNHNSDDVDQYELCQWLWPRLLQMDLDKWASFRNGVPMRKQKGKPGPSGVKAMSQNEAFINFESWGGVNCLLKVDKGVIRQMKEDMGGDALIAFSTPEFAARAEQAFESLGVVLTQKNVWDVFQAMLPADDAGQVCTKVASYLEQGQRLKNLSWQLWHRQYLMVDTDNAKSKREFKKLSKCMGDKLDKEKGRSIEELPAPDFKRNSSTDLICQRAVEKERTREASQHTPDHIIQRMQFTFAVEPAAPATTTSTSTTSTTSKNTSTSTTTTFPAEKGTGNSASANRGASASANKCKRAAAALDADMDVDAGGSDGHAVRLPGLFSNSFGPAVLLYPSPSLAPRMNYRENEKLASDKRLHTEIRNLQAYQCPQSHH
ncbi:hypothetical protein MVEN_00130200 [Mycena venus]|uniref:Nitrogen regulatory protein areA GATA-like domain-containing protein n=1 Tax=Mycena venus TaxID=2733690 RepID=A0A8H7DEN8_9AGAR|nr:hypothetical protein MVEN_00130200 [Mycena venus]